MQVITEGKDLTIAFNVRYITDVLKALSDDQIVMRFNSNVSPCVVCPVEGDSYLYLVLPGSRVQRISADAGDVAQPEPFQELRTRAHRAGRGRDRVHRPGTAQGKTNVLEALHLCCLGKSHRTSRAMRSSSSGGRDSRARDGQNRAAGRHARGRRGAPAAPSDGRKRPCASA